MDHAAEQLEVVRGDGDAADRDEHEQPVAPGDGGADPDRDGSAEPNDREPDQHRRRDPGLQRPAVQLVERVCGHSEARKNARHRPRASGRDGTAARARRRARRTRGSRACTARAAASRSRASRPGGGRRTRVLRPLASPRHIPAAQLTAASADVVDPRVAPGLDEPRQRPARRRSPGSSRPETIRPPASRCR